MLKLRDLRKQNKLSMKELGATLGLAESTISLYETGKREPDIATLIKISNYFNVSVDELLGCDNSDDSLDAEYRATIREVHTPVMINFENMCSSLDEKTLGRIHVILHSIRQIQNNIDINVIDKQYLFACIAEFVGRTELYVDNIHSLSDNLNNLDLSQYNKIYLNAAIEILKDIMNIMCSSENSTSHIKTIILPMYMNGASAGTGNWLSDDIPVEWMTVPQNENTKTADYMLKVCGDSMQPRFFDGDVLLIKETPAITEGEIGIFIVNGESFVKKMGNGELISLNPAYDNIKLNENDDIRCAGKVLGTINLN